MVVNVYRAYIIGHAVPYRKHRGILTHVSRIYGPVAPVERKTQKGRVSDVFARRLGVATPSRGSGFKPAVRLLGSRTFATAGEIKSRELSRGIIRVSSVHPPLELFYVGTYYIHQAFQIILSDLHPQRSSIHRILRRCVWGLKTL